MNKAINAIETYKPMTDRLQSVLIIKLKSGKDIFALFDHEKADPYLISNLELITELRALADHIEKN